MRTHPIACFFLFFNFFLLFSSSTAQQQSACQSYAFAGSQEAFTNCVELHALDSFLHWSYDASSGRLRMAYRHSGVSESTWVAWGINPNSATQAMPGAQTVFAVPQTGSAPRVNTSAVSGYTIQTLEPSTISYPVTGLTATYQNTEIIIFATWTLPAGTTSINQVWQAGPVSGGALQSHSTNVAANLNSKGVLDLRSGSSQSTRGADSVLRRRNIHGVLNAVSWGILLPIGAIIARQLKVFKSADPAWFYLHVTCQTAAYVVGVAGWGTGLKLGSDSPGITENPHRAIGIALFCLGTLQVFALLLRPKKDHKFRFYWNIYHHMVGYAVISLSIANVYVGFDILDPEKVWKRAYTGVIVSIGVVAVVLEAYTWFYVLKKRRSESKSPYNANGTNGANGYGASRTHNEV